MITPHFLGGVAPVAPSPRGWESACRVRRAPKPNCFGVVCCGAGIPLLRPVDSSESLLCHAEGVIGALVLLSRAVVGPVLRSLGRGAACSADGPRRGRAAGAREWTPTNAITRWRMRPNDMAIALTRQVIQCRCQCTIPIVRIGVRRLSL